MNVRDSFFNTIYELTRNGEDISLVSSDLGAPSLDNFRRDFPQRFVNVGIAEQNSISVAAGLSLAGKKTLTYGLNPFPVTRAFDQIRNLLGGFQYPVAVTALKAGTSAAEAGLSHMAFENMSLMRTLRNVRLYNPTDEIMSRKIAQNFINNPKPIYVQFDPQLKGIIYDEDDIDIEKGFISNGLSGDIAIISYGIWIPKLIDANLPVRLIDCFALPLDEDELVKEICNCKKIITIEDGVEQGGIGSMMLEIMNKRNVSIPIKRLSLEFNRGYPGKLVSREDVFEMEGLTIDAIKQEIR